MNSFSERFFKISSNQSSFCFGLDPSEELIHLWNLPYNKQGLLDFCSIFLEAIEKSGAGVIKLQVAFFEAFGPDGLFVLKEVILKAKALGLLVIADVKRGDIGKTSKAYAEAWFRKERGFQADAITLSPYLGLSSLMPFVEVADQCQGGLFIVLRSSNIEASEVQKSFIFREDQIKEFLFQRIGLDIQRVNEKRYSNSLVGTLGAVIGGNLKPERPLLELIEKMTKSLFLVPGVGAQGGTFESVERLFGKSIKRVIFSSSSAVLKFGPERGSLVRKMKELMEGAKRLQLS